MKKWTLKFVVGLGAIVGGTGSALAIDVCAIEPVSAQSKYEEVFQPTCHNCYEIAVAEKMGAKTFKQVLDTVKNVEIDFYDTRDGVSGGVAKEWYVRHGLGTLFQSGNDNNCTGNGNGSNNLGACLTDVKQWSDAHPGHDPITVFLDKKQAWSSVGEQRRPADLDQLVRGILGDKLYVPSTLLGTQPTLRQAAQAHSWPTMGSLAGKVILVLTGGQLENHNKTLSEYVNDTRNGAALFVAVDTDEIGDITGTPNQFNSTTASYLVFYNIEATSQRDALGQTTRANSYVSRLWNGDSQNPCAILSNCINDNALKEWNKGACSGQASGTLRLNPDGWLPEQKESSSNFVCGTNRVMNGRWHNCKNKGTKCDENGNSTVHCRTMLRAGVPYQVGAGTYSANIKESAGTSYLCPTNQVMNGRKHSGDENGTTNYLCAPLTYEGSSVPVNPNAGSWSTEIVESTSEYICPDNQILNGRMHKGDENGKTSYHCIPDPTP